MKAIKHQESSPHNLPIQEVPKPSIQATEVLIKVKAAGLNRADIMQKQGLYPPPNGASEILGLEVAGVIEEIGAQCSRFSVGTPVMALLAGGGYAEYVACDERLLMPIPKGYSFEQAAAIPEAFITAYQALFDLGRLQVGNFVLIHGGASGVGTAAIQLGKLAGAKVIATAGSAEKLDHCRKLGAIEAVNYKTSKFDTVVKSLSDKKGASVIIDIAGASHYEQNMRSIGIDGRWVVLAMMGGRYAESFDFARLLMKRVQLMGSTLRARELGYKAQLIEAFSMRFLPAFEQGLLVPAIDKVFPWQAAGSAHTYMEQNSNMGKIVLVVDGD